VRPQAGETSKNENSTRFSATAARRGK